MAAVPGHGRDAGLAMWVMLLSLPM